VIATTVTRTLLDDANATLADTEKMKILKMNRSGSVKDIEDCMGPVLQWLSVKMNPTSQKVIDDLWTHLKDYQPPKKEMFNIMKLKNINQQKAVDLLKIAIYFCVHGPIGTAREVNLQES